EGALLSAVDSFHRESPLQLGANRRELRKGRLAGLSERVFDGMVARLVDQGHLVVEGPLLRLARFTVALTPDQIALRSRLLEQVVGAGLVGLSPKALAEASPEPEALAL